jgi:hypothetical protein
MPTPSFAELGVSSAVCDALARRGITREVAHAHAVVQAIGDEHRPPYVQRVLRDARSIPDKHRIGGVDHRVMSRLHHGRQEDRRQSSNHQPQF